MLPVLTGVRIEIVGSNISLLATDRFRLSLRELEWNPGATDAEANALVPARVLADTGAPVSCAAAETWFCGRNSSLASMPGVEVALRRSSGPWP